MTEFCRELPPRIQVGIEGRTAHVHAWQHTVKRISGHEVPVILLDAVLRRGSVAWQDGGVKRQLFQSRPTRQHFTPREKAEILLEHQRSGLSLLAFAGKQGLCYASLLCWRCRQRDEATAAAPPDTEGDPGFVPVKIEGEVWGGDYVLSWAGGRSLKIPRQFETDSLRRLLTVLEGVK